MMKTSGRYFLLTAMLGLALFSSAAQALTCKAGTSVSETVAIDSVLKASVGDFGANTKIWVSSPITATFTCTDTNGYPKGENAYLWLDPNDVVKNIHNSLEVGITYKNVDYKLIKGDKIEIGPATLCRSDGRGGCLSPATSQTFTLTYQVYIKTTGLPAADDGKVMGNVSLSLFQVDGVGGLRVGSGGNDGNFNLYITGLNNITFIACTPRVTLVPDTLDFGVINARWAAPGRIEKTKSFNVIVDLTREKSGKTCTGETLLLTLSSSNPVKDGSIIMPVANSGFGFIISENSNLLPRIPLNTPQTFGMISGDHMMHEYYAGFVWTAISPLLGDYSATATVTVTFK
ncbi:fimbrial protein [Enterobacteriaceae bacterium H4N4]|uniref:Fimbrial protein n=1 Tax=Silvania confinis TaxID=2926470 RepID=A0A9J6Q6R9_9ENTR|nr:fimbrial protein [Silvania confinis]MCU6668255.1 fimbrial protein [Silvania confinis]